MKAPTIKLDIEKGWEQVDNLFKDELSRESNKLFTKIEASLNKNIAYLNATSGKAKPAADILHDSIQEGFTAYMKNVYKARNTHVKML